jgi:drug/metabolite transporter (DMT)-like permease
MTGDTPINNEGGDPKPPFLSASKRRLDDNVMKGALFIFVSVFMIAAMNALAKFLGTSYHPIELVLYRNIPILAGLCLYFHYKGRWKLVETHRIRSHITRALIGTSGVVLAFSAVLYLPLADAVTLMYAAPIFVTLLSYPLLKEKVGPWRTGAVLVGFIGIVIVAMPSGSSLSGLGVSLALAAALFHALTQLLLRDLGRSEHPLTTVFYFMLIGSIACTLCLPFIDANGPALSDSGLLLLLAIAGGTQQILKTRGYAMAPTSVVTPLNYTGLLWASLFGFIIWQEIPGANIWAGAFLIITANFFILWREKIKRGA